MLKINFHICKTTKIPSLEAVGCRASHRASLAQGAVPLHRQPSIAGNVLEDLAKAYPLSDSEYLWLNGARPVQGRLPYLWLISMVNIYG